jgi:hypothetical protein
MQLSHLPRKCHISSVEKFVASGGGRLLLKVAIMVETHAHFVKRLTTLGQKHAKMTRGYSMKVNKDGLLTAKPKRARRSLPIRGLFLVVFGFFALKAFMLASVGPVTYNERLAKLESGTVVERAGAKAMSIDPITATFATIAGPVLR